MHCTGLRKAYPLLLTAGVLLSLIACTPAPPSAPQSTVQAAGTQVSGAVGAAATAVQTGVVQPTVSAAGTTVSTNRTAVVGTVQAGATATVGTAQSSATSAVGTAVTGATNVAAGRQAAATAVAPTAQAVATQVAPTIQAAATQIVGAVSTSVAASPVQIKNVDSRANDPSVTLQNVSSTTLSLNGWTLFVGPNFAVTLENIPLAANEKVTLHFSQGTDTPSDIYLGFGTNVAQASLSAGSRVVLVAPSNDVASVYAL